MALIGDALSTEAPRGPRLEGSSFRGRTWSPCGEMGHKSYGGRLVLPPKPLLCPLGQMASPVCTLVPRSPLIGPSLNTSLHRGALAGLKEREAGVGGHTTAGPGDGCSPPHLGGAEQDLALEEMVELKLKGKPGHLLPLSTASPLRGWRCPDHSQPGRCQGLEKRPPVPGAASATTAHPARGICHLGPDSASLVSLNMVGLIKGAETDPRVFVGFPAKGLPPRPPASTHIWAHLQHPAPIHGATRSTQHPHVGQGSTSGATRQITTLLTPRPTQDEAQRASWGAVHNLGWRGEEAAQAGPALGDS